MRALFFREGEIFSPEISLNREELEHLKSLRLFSIDKEVEFRNGIGQIAVYSVLSQKSRGNLIHSENISIEEKSLSLASAIPASGKFEFLLQKGTEIGITDFHFIVFAHSDRKEINIERSKKIILNSCSQTRRNSIPKIYFYKSLKEFLNQNANVMYLHPYLSSGYVYSPEMDLTPIIGPEGGFKEEELDLFVEKKISGFHLGPNILRIETAALSISAIIDYERKKNNGFNR